MDGIGGAIRPPRSEGFGEGERANWEAGPFSIARVMSTKYRQEQGIQGPRGRGFQTWGKIGRTVGKRKGGAYPYQREKRWELK